MNKTLTLRSEWRCQQPVLRHRSAENDPRIFFRVLAQAVVLASIVFGVSCGVGNHDQLEVPGIPKYVWNKPSPYVDQQTGVTYSVGRDGRHVTARASDGRVIWKRNPFKDAKMEAYRVSQPRVNFIGEADRPWLTEKMGSYIEIAFDSSQFGIMNAKTGDFRCLGQD